MSIRKRQLKNGKDVYDVMLRRPDHTQYQRTFATKKAAVTWEARELADMSRYRWVDPSAGDRNFAEYAREWLDLRPGLRPKTIELYRSLLKRHVIPAFGKHSLRAITKPEVRAWNARLLRERSRTTAANSYRLLAAIMNTAVDDELIGASPCRIRGASDQKTAERKIPTLAEFFAVVEAIEPRYRAMLLLAGLCGLRLGELQGLTRADIDLVARSVRVDKQAQELADAITINEPKTAAGVRTVALPSSIISDLEDHIGRFVKVAPDSPLFPGPNGGLRRATFYKVWREAKKKAGASPSLRLHDLRHLANTLAARVPGTTTKDLMARIGHASAQASLRYQHASLEADRRISDGIDQAISDNTRAMRSGLDHPTPACQSGPRAAAPQ